MSCEATKPAESWVRPLWIWGVTPLNSSDVTPRHILPVLGSTLGLLTPPNPPAEAFSSGQEGKQAQVLHC